MLQHDYLEEVIGQFVRAVRAALSGGAAKRPEAPREVERAVADLLDLGVDAAMSLSPQSLVTMMSLSGVGESVAAYVSFALDRVADLREAAGEGEVASLRRAQASAVAEAFHATGEVPPELEGV